MQVVKSLPNDAKPRIVRLLEELLVAARKGEITGIIVLTEDGAGDAQHYRDGIPDHGVVFSLELIKRRVLEKYE